MADLNYDNPEVREAIKNVVRFWFDLGVDGFRLDVAHLYYEDADYCAHHPRTHAFHRELRQVADEYDERMLVGEVAGGPDQLTAYLGDGANELHMILNFDLTYAFYAALYLHAPLAVDLMMDAMWARFPPGGTQAVFYSNHDFFRFYGLLFQNDDWAKMAVALQMTLPGTPFVYYGEEVGMGNGREIKIDYRDVARTPMHWDATANAGFTTGEPWMRLAPNHWTNNVAVEDDDPASLLSFYRRIIALRNAHRALQTGDFLLVGSGAFPVYAYFREFGDEALLVVVNMSALTQTAALRLTGTPWGGRSGRVRDLLWGAALPPLTATASGDYSLDVPGFGFAMLKLDAE
jgi:glycosidase